MQNVAQIKKAVHLIKTMQIKKINYLVELITKINNMKHNYIKTTKRAVTFVVLLLGLVTYSQDIHFTFENAQNTNDGVDDFYDVDVMIQTINTTGTFKLGSGQLYFNYSTAAFGTNVFGSGGFYVPHPNPDYIAGQYIDAAAADIYGP